MAKDETESDNDPRTKHQALLISEFRSLIGKGEMHLWIADALLNETARLTPMVVERHETLKDNLEIVFQALNEQEQAHFRAAISRAANDPYWPPNAVSPARALRDLLRLARLSGHYGLLRWAGENIISLMRKPKSIDDLKVLSETILILTDIERWVPSQQEEGPDYRFVLEKLYTIFKNLEGKKALSFLDAVLLLPAVRYRRENWWHAVCQAIQRYDIRDLRIFPANIPSFGSDGCPEGKGLYNLRACIQNVIADLTLEQYQHGIQSLAEKRTEYDGACGRLLQILNQIDFIIEKHEIIRENENVNPNGVLIFSTAIVVYFGPAYKSLGLKGGLRFVTGAEFKTWRNKNWSVFSIRTGDRPIMQLKNYSSIIGYSAGSSRLGRVAELPARSVRSPKESEELRSFDAFKNSKTASPLMNGGAR